jgi:hypothetical protein
MNPSVKTFKDLPCYVIWGIWLNRNQVVFEDKGGYPSLVAHKVRAAFREKKKEAPRKVVMPLRAPSFNLSVAWGYFDGACQGVPGSCGAGIVLYLTFDHFFHLKFKVGLGTNNRGELIALWVLLNFAQDKGIRNIQVFGDSKLVVDWFKGRAQLVILALLPWQHRIRELQEAYDFVTIEHVYWNSIIRLMHFPRRQ